jgi:hypothetical protein
MKLGLDLGGCGTLARVRKASIYVRHETWEAWRTFARQTQELYARLTRRARESEQALDYALENLQLSILAGLDVACPHCGKVYGLESWAVTYVTSLDRGPGGFTFRNLVVTCKRCALARGTLRVDVWLDVLTSLNAEADDQAERFIDRLVSSALATRQRDRGGGSRYFRRWGYCR